MSEKAPIIFGSEGIEAEVPILSIENVPITPEEREAIRKPYELLKERSDKLEKLYRKISEYYQAHPEESLFKDGVVPLHLQDSYKVKRQELELERRRLMQPFVGLGKELKKEHKIQLRFLKEIDKI